MFLAKPLRVWLADKVVHDVFVLLRLSFVILVLLASSEKSRSVDRLLERQRI